MGTKTPDYTLSGSFPYLRSCRLAYTLNNDQPVRCTYISDQPFFYMDIEEGDFEDGFDLFDDENLDILEKDIADLRRGIESCDRLSESFSLPADQWVSDFAADCEIICAPAPHKLDESRQGQKGCEDISAVTCRLEKSRFARALLNFALENELIVTYSRQAGTAVYDRAAGAIFINPRLESGDQLLLLIRELRRHWQYRHGALADPLSFHPDQAVLVHRAQQADLCVMMVRCAWELQLAGVQEAWARVENSSLHDLGRAIAREAFQDFRTLQNGQAAASVFESWFLSERCRYEDNTLIQNMLSGAKDVVPEDEQGARMVTADLITALGSVPYGKNYLAAHTHLIMEDPIFTDVRDRSNANFLWFIKFERSFQETERELQSDDLIHNCDGAHNLSDKTDKDSKYESGGQIYGHPDAGGARQAERYPQCGLESGARGSNIIYVQFGAGHGAHQTS